MKLQDINIRSTRALQPAATTVPIGTSYYVTDELVTERSNGTIWQSISDGGALADNAVTTVKILNDAVTYAKIQNVTDARLLGRSAGSAGDAQEITVGAGLSLAAGALTAVGTDWTTSVTKVTDLPAVTNSSTLVDDNDLIIAVLANEIWHFEAFILYSGDSTAADFKWTFAVSTGTMFGTLFYTGVTVSDTSAGTTIMLAANNVALFTAQPDGTDGVDGIRSVYARVTVTFSANCNFKLQYAQNTITAAKTVKVRAGSILRGKKLL